MLPFAPMATAKLTANEVKDLRAGRVPEPKADEDEDCLPSVQEEIASILGLNPGRGI